MKSHLIIFLSYILAIVPGCRTVSGESSQVKEESDVFYYKTTESYKKLASEKPSFMGHFDNAVYDLDKALRSEKFMIFAIDKENPRDRRKVEDVARFTQLDPRYTIFYARDAFSTHFINVETDIADSGEHITVIFTDYHHDKQRNRLVKRRGTSTRYYLQGTTPESFKSQMMTDSKKLKAFANQLAIQEQKETGRAEEANNTWLIYPLTYGVSAAFVGAFFGIGSLANAGKISAGTAKWMGYALMAGIVAVIVGMSIYAAYQLFYEIGDKKDQQKTRLQLKDLHQELTQAMAKS